MSLLQCCLPDEGRCAVKVTVFESPQSEVATRCVAKAEGNCLDGGGLVLFDGLSEGEWFTLKRLQSNLPPRCGVAFNKYSNLHSLHSNFLRSDIGTRPGRAHLGPLRAN